MKNTRKMFLSIGTPLFAVTPAFLAISCSNTNGSKTDYAVSSNDELYSTIWNLSLFKDKDIISNSIFDLYLFKDLETKVNASIKKDKTNDFIMKVYCFYMLWNAFKNPLSSTGNVLTNLSTEITEFSTFLSDTLVADNKDENNDDKKTYNKFKSFINKISYEIKFFYLKQDKNNSDNVTIASKDNDVTLSEMYNSDNTYLLNFQLQFKIDDEETNNKMISTTNTNKSIMYKTNLSREQRLILKNIKNVELKSIVQNQFDYQSTKMFYDLEKKQFSTIILPSNICNNVTEKTVNSGFGSNDKERRLLEFNWYSSSSTSTSFSSYFNILLDSTNNFSISLNNDWRNFLKKEKILDDSGKMKKIMVDLEKNFKFNMADYE